MRSLWLVALTALVGCSNDFGTPASDALLLSGQESEPWLGDTAPSTIAIDLVTDTGQRVNVGKAAAAPFTTISLHDPGGVPSGTIGAFEAIGISADGAPVLRGSTIQYLLYSLADIRVPIFVGRAGGWSRPPDKLLAGRKHPVTGTVFHEYVVAVGGEVGPDANPAIPDFYDLATWSALSKQDALPRSPKSLVIVGNSALLIDDVGATWAELTGDFRVTAVALPAGLTSFAEVAGGDVWSLADGSSYVVGATRAAGDATAKVLRINKDGYVTAISLNTPRAGAAAGVVGGNLYVWGGSTEGAGGESLNKTFDGFTPLPFPPDPTTGLGLLAISDTAALLAGGNDPMTSTPAAVRTIDTTCTVGCTSSDVIASPVGITRTKIFTVSPTEQLITGEAEDGEFRSWLLHPATPDTVELVEQRLRQPRRAATAVLLPNMQPGVVGGQDIESGASVLTMEEFFP